MHPVQLISCTYLIKYSVLYSPGHGEDFYDILRNKCILDLNGEAGDDSFVVRSFVMVVADDGSLEYPNLG
jgi:hypothetical protein